MRALKRMDWLTGSNLSPIPSPKRRGVPFHLYREGNKYHKLANIRDKKGKASGKQVKILYQAPLAVSERGRG